MSKRPGKQDADTPEHLSFEDAAARLEAIIERIESGKIGLEQAIAEYERGAALVRRCREILDRAEQRVAELAAETDGARNPGNPGNPDRRARARDDDDEEADDAAPF